MGQFRFVSIEKQWQDCYSNFDDDWIKDFIRQKIDEGYTRDMLIESVEEKLKDCCWDDVDYGDIFDSDTIDVDFCDDDDEGVDSVSIDLVDSVLDEDDDGSSGKVLGGLGDD